MTQETKKVSVTKEFVRPISPEKWPNAEDFLRAQKELLQTGQSFRQKQREYMQNPDVIHLVGLNKRSQKFKKL